MCREYEVPTGAVWVNLRQNLTLVPVVGVWQYGAEFEVFDCRSTWSASRLYPTGTHGYLLPVSLPACVVVLTVMVPTPD